MSVPDFQSLMLPTLKSLADGGEVPLSDVREHVAAVENLIADDLQEMLPSGQQSVFVNRVSWAMVYLGRAGLTERVRRGVWQLTDEGRRLLANPPSRVDMSYLQKYPAYVAWRTGKSGPSSSSDATSSMSDDSRDTPEEALEKAARQLRKALEAEILDRVREASPSFLEQVVVHLLIAMGYGGGDPTMGRVTGRSGDGGIDGTIKEDALGLDEVYVQAKKYAAGSTVGEGDLRNFAGAIDAAGTTKGVFVTTASFTRAARDYVARSPKRIVLIDGEDLARHMARYNIGARERDQDHQQDYYKIKRIDEDYFDQEAL
ncbi:MAG: restriction endonuclease [Gammaproteobacteria bacterium]|nr:restriction endonuclease [Gammaproteobacteria bacterium]